jgi:hypothetical protein
MIEFQIAHVIAALPRAEARIGASVLFILAAPFLIYGLWRPERSVARLRPDAYGAPLFPRLKRTTVVRLLCLGGLALVTFFMVVAFTCRDAIC